VLGNGGDKLFGSEDPEVGPALAVGHLGAIDGGAGLLLVAHPDKTFAQVATLEIVLHDIPDDQPEIAYDLANRSWQCCSKL